jgi:hypothetical protein
MATLRSLQKIFAVANRHSDAFVDAALLDAWQIRVTAMPLAPRDFCAAAPFFNPFPAAQLVEPYEQRLRAECFLDDDDDGVVVNPWLLAIDPKWRRSAAVLDALLVRVFALPGTFWPFPYDS